MTPIAPNSAVKPTTTPSPATRRVEPIEAVLIRLGELLTRDELHVPRMNMKAVAKECQKRRRRFRDVAFRYTFTPLAPNIDFFAAILGGDASMGHKVVYFEMEMQFYFYEPLQKLFKPTTEAKLGNLLRAYLMKCAEELPESVHKLNLFLDFRSDKTIRAIVQRAKSILAADETFFGVKSEHQRQKGPEIHERIARIFAEQVLERQPGQILTLTNAYLIFTEYLKQKSMAPLRRGDFKGMFSPIIREVFDLGLRNDIMDPGSRHQTAGWKGIRPVQDEITG